MYFQIPCFPWAVATLYQPIILVNFPQKLHEKEKFGPRGACISGAPRSVNGVSPQWQKTNGLIAEWEHHMTSTSQVSVPSQLKTIGPVKQIGLKFKEQVFTVQPDLQPQEPHFGYEALALLQPAHSVRIIDELGTNLPSVLRWTLESALLSAAAAPLGASKQQTLFSLRYWLFGIRVKSLWFHSLNNNTSRFKAS